MGRYPNSASPLPGSADGDRAVLRYVRCPGSSRLPDRARETRRPQRDHDCAKSATSCLRVRASLHWIWVDALLRQDVIFPVRADVVCHAMSQSVVQRDRGPWRDELQHDFRRVPSRTVGAT